MTDYEKEYQKGRDVCGAPFREFVAFFDRYPQAGARVLDLGCGQGRDALFIARQGHHVLGVDISRTGIAQMLADAAVEGLDVRGVVADVVEYEPDGDYDVVLLDRVLHMLPDDGARVGVLERARAVTRPGGYILIADTPKHQQLIRSFFDGYAAEWETVKDKKGFIFAQKSGRAIGDRAHAATTAGSETVYRDCDQRLKPVGRKGERMRFRFAPAAEDECMVFGAARPGYPARAVDEGQVREWLLFMKDQGIQRVCCLLSPEQLEYYREDLLARYRQAFGAERVCWAPVEDYQLADARTLQRLILPFLAASDANQERVVVHCSGGIGRTGHILAAWLVHGRQFEVEDALAAVRKLGRNPFEAVECGTATRSQLYALLHACRGATQP